MTDKVVAVITAKNEEDSIGSIVHNLHYQQGYDIIVVDDGSTDKTGELAQSNGANVIRHETSQGIASSLLEAWSLAYILGADYVFQMDAGHSQLPHESPNLVAFAKEKKLDIAIGSRFIRGSSYQGRPWRATASRIAAHLMNFAAHSKIKDWSSGYRVFSRNAIEKLLTYRYHSRMHAWQMEVLARALIDGLKVAEFPIMYFAGYSSLNWTVIDESISVWLWRFFY